MPLISATLNNKEIRTFKAIPANSIVTVTPATSATVTVEYSVSNLAAVESGIAVWNNWPKSTLSTTATVSDKLETLAHVRVTSSGAGCTVQINTDPTLADLEPFERDWALVENRVIYQNASGSIPATLTNPLVQLTNSVDNYTQIAIQNKSATANASADLIAYPDNVTSSDLTGFMDMGITSSAYAQASYAVTGQNEGYLFMSAPSGAGKTGDMIIATDSTGSSNNISFAVNGFTALTKKVMTIFGSKRVSINSGAAAPTDNGTDTLQVTGSIITQGAANNLQISGATTTNPVRVTATGTDSNIGVGYSAKGLSGHTFYNNNFGSICLVTNAPASAVNYITVNGAVTTVSPSFAATGSDPNIGITFQAKGTGNILSTLGALGYGTGNGGTVTQLTSRTTSVTLNKPSGQITLFSAAGSATAASFTVTNSYVTAQDTVMVCQASGTNLYNCIVTAVGAGSFAITFYTTGGTATDAPVFNFNVIKGINA